MFTEIPNQGETDTWLTPPWIYRALGNFDLDPCGHPLSETAMRRWVWPHQDGLKEDWYGRVWLNPPYGNQTGIWLNRLARHGRGTALILARTDTRWLQNHLRLASCVLFMAGRLKFLTPQLTATGSCKVPSLLLAYGKQDGEILFNSSIKGWKVKQYQ